MYSCVHCGEEFDDVHWFNAQLHNTVCPMKKAMEVEQRNLATLDNFWE